MNLWEFVVCFGIFVVGFGQAASLHAEVQAQDSTTNTANYGAAPGQYDAVVVISVSGVGSDVLNLTSPKVAEVLSHSTYTLNARSTLPSTAIAAISAALFSADPMDLGTVTDAWRGFDRATMPSLFSPPHSLFDAIACYRESALAYAVVRDGALGPLFQRYCSGQEHSTCVDQCQSTVFVGTAASDQEAITTATKLFERTRPQLLFVQLSEPSIHAHYYGWGSSEHTTAVEYTFGYVAQLASRAVTFPAMNVCVIVIGDTSGDPRPLPDKKHFVPFLILGPPPTGPSLDSRPVHVRDVAPTAAMALGLNARFADWTGFPANFGFNQQPRPQPPQQLQPQPEQQLQSQPPQRQQQAQPQETYIQYNQPFTSPPQPAPPQQQQQPPQQQQQQKNSPAAVRPGSSTVTHVSGPEMQKMIRDAVGQAMGDLDNILGPSTPKDASVDSVHASPSSQQQPQAPNPVSSENRAIQAHDGIDTKSWAYDSRGGEKVQPHVQSEDNTQQPSPAQDQHCFGPICVSEKRS